MKIVNGINVPSGALLLYEQIKALSRKHSFCWAGNGYLEFKTGLSKKTCSKYLKILADAGMIARDYAWDDDEKTVQVRRLFAVKEEIYMQPAQNPSVTLADVLAMGEMQKQEAELKEEQKAQRARLYKHADLLGIRRASLYKALMKWGADKLEEAFCNAETSHAKNPVKLFFAYLWNGWKPKARAKAKIGKDPKPRRLVPVPDVEPERKPLTAKEQIETADRLGVHMNAKHRAELEARAAEEATATAEAEQMQEAPAEKIVKNYADLLPDVAEKEPAVNIAKLQAEILQTRDRAWRERKIMQLPADRREAMRQMCREYGNA